MPEHGSEHTGEVKRVGETRLLGHLADRMALPTAECSGGGAQPACWRSRDGHLWFTTAKGAVWVDPNEVPLIGLHELYHLR
jgi:hypothetical protein